MSNDYHRIRTVKDGLASLKTCENLTDGQKEQLQAYIDRLDGVVEG